MASPKGEKKKKRDFGFVVTWYSNGGYSSFADHIIRAY